VLDDFGISGSVVGSAAQLTRLWTGKRGIVSIAGRFGFDVRHVCALADRGAWWQPHVGGEAYSISARGRNIRVCPWREQRATQGPGELSCVGTRRARVVHCAGCAGTEPRAGSLPGSRET